MLQQNKWYFAQIFNKTSGQIWGQKSQTIYNLERMQQFSSIYSHYIFFYRLCKTWCIWVCIFSDNNVHSYIYADIYFERNVMSHKNLIDTTNYIIPMNICLAKTTCELHLDVTWEKWLSSFENNKICEMTQTRDDIVRWQPNLASYPAAIEDWLGALPSLLCLWFVSIGG